MTDCKVRVVSKNDAHTVHKGGWVDTQRQTTHCAAMRLLNQTATESLIQLPLHSRGMVAISKTGLDSVGART